MKSMVEANPKANNAKIHVRGQKRHCCTHTYKTQCRSKPWGLSPVRHWTLQGRQHLLTSIFNTAKKNTVFSENFSFSLCLATVSYTGMWTLIFPSKWHTSSVQVAIESSQVPRGSHTVTKSHFAQEILTDMEPLPFKALPWHLSFPPTYVRCSVVCFLSVSLSLCFFVPLYLFLLEETQSGNCICSGSKVQQTHTCSRSVPAHTLCCFSMGSRPVTGLKTSEGVLQEAVDKVTGRPYAPSCSNDIENYVTVTKKAPCRD